MKNRMFLPSTTANSAGFGLYITVWRSDLTAVYCPVTQFIWFLVYLHESKPQPTLWNVNCRLKAGTLSFTESLHMNISSWKTATSPHIAVLVSLNPLSLNNWPPAAVFTGKYVMVMGVIQAVSPEPVIRAVKMADLSELAALHRRMWKLEVEDLQQVLAWMQRRRLAGGRTTRCCHLCPAWCAASERFLTNGETASQDWTADFTWCRASDCEVWCKSDKDSDMSQAVKRDA